MAFTPEQIAYARSHLRVSAYVCVKCGFRVDRMTLHAKSGEITDYRGPFEEACPNGCRIDGARVMLVRIVEGTGVPGTVVH